MGRRLSVLSLHASLFRSTAEGPQPLLRVHTASDEFGALTHDLRQSRFASLVHERQVVQLNDASARVTFAVSFSPGRPELGCPPTNQATRERPSLLVKRIGNGDPQHYSPLACPFTCCLSANPHHVSYSPLFPLNSPATAQAYLCDGQKRIFRGPLITH